MMRVVLDTNVFISSVLGGRVGRIVDGWKAGTFILIVSADIVGEYLDVITKARQ